MSDERFLVTGALGCIGAWSVKQLLDENVPVWTYDLPGNPHRLKLILDDDALAKPLPRRRAQHSLGTAAEVGARAQLSERVSVDAALRWTKLRGDMALLQSDSGLTSADAVIAREVYWKRVLMTREHGLNSN